MQTLVYTIGHSTRSLAEFIDLLKAHAVVALIDVRTIPRSRHNPQFNRAEFSRSLSECGIGYKHLPGLGGLRRRQAQSPNAGWRNTSFQGYADYMQTKEFADSLDELIAVASHEQVAIMCAEAVPWRCHRSLIGDALLVRGISVEEISSLIRTQPHKLTAFAQVTGNAIIYPPEQPATGLLF